MEKKQQKLHIMKCLKLATISAPAAFGILIILLFMDVSMLATEINHPSNLWTGDPFRPVVKASPSQDLGFSYPVRINYNFTFQFADGHTTYYSGSQPVVSGQITLPELRMPCEVVFVSMYAETVISFKKIIGRSEEPRDGVYRNWTVNQITGAAELKPEVFSFCEGTLYNDVRLSYVTGGVSTLDQLWYSKHPSITTNNTPTTVVYPNKFSVPSQESQTWYVRTRVGSYNNSGCYRYGPTVEVNFKRIPTGPNPGKLNFPDTICLGAGLPLTNDFVKNNENNTNFQIKWYITGSYHEAVEGGIKTAYFDNLGNKSISLSIYGPPGSYGCTSASSKTVYVKDCYADAICCPSFFAPQPGRYFFQGWVSYDGSLPKTEQPHYKLTVKYQNNSVQVFEFTPDENKNIDGWYAVSGNFNIAPLALELNLEMINNSTAPAYFDDIRIQPFNSMMKGYVFDNVNKRMTAELDENNFATFFEYDEEGNLIRVKKETERGIMTIKESNQNQVKP